VTDTIRRQNHDGLKTFGVGQDKPKSAWTALGAKTLRRRRAGRGQRRAWRLLPDPKGEDILFGREPIALRADPFADRRTRRAGREAARADGLDEGTAGLFEHLRSFGCRSPAKRASRPTSSSPTAP
jgi:ATP-dependent DNA helicase RecQ